MRNGPGEKDPQSKQDGRKGNRRESLFESGGTAVVRIASADSRGIPLCGKLLDRGWTLYVCAPEPLRLPPELVSRGCRLLNADTVSAETMHRAAGAVKDAAVPVDLLLYCLDAPDERAVGIDRNSGDRFDGMLRDYDVCALDFLRFAEAFVPLMEGGRKRIAALAEPSGSLPEAADPQGDGMAMAAAALRMAMKIMANDLQRDGFTFRMPETCPTSLAETDPSEALLPSLLSGPGVQERGDL